MSGKQCRSWWYAAFYTVCTGLSIWIHTVNTVMYSVAILAASNAVLASSKNIYWKPCALAPSYTSKILRSIWLFYDSLKKCSLNCKQCTLHLTAFRKWYFCMALYSEDDNLQTSIMIQCKTFCCNYQYTKHFAGLRRPVGGWSSLRSGIANLNPSWSILVAVWLTLSTLDPEFASCWRWNLAYVCMALHFTEPCIITLPSSRYESASVALLDACPTDDQEVAGSTPAGSATFFCGFLAKECAEYWLTP